jgi:predicted N-formylglutamate amidohydrolase
LNRVTADWALVVSCEHASRDVPAGVELGVPEEVFDTHASWDPGAKEVAEAIAAARSCPLFLGRYSRIFVDLNRSPGSAEAIPVNAFGVEVPGNRRLDPEARTARIAAHHAPYWEAVSQAVRTPIARSQPVLHLSIHSFVEVYKGVHRPVDLGVLLDPARRLERLVADRLLESFTRSGFDARENEPYDGRTDALTTSIRASIAEELYAGVEIEINQRWLPKIDRVREAVLAAVAELFR